MGVTGSKRSYTLGDAKQGTGTDSKGQFDKAEPGAEGPPPEESAADKKMKNVNMWKAFLTAIIEMKDAKDPLQKAVLTEKTLTTELTKKGVVIDKDAVKNFASGDGDYLPELILYLGEVGLKPSEGEQIKFNSAEALKISTAEPGRKGPKQTLKKEVKFSDVEKTFFLSIIDAARVAKKHTVFRKILKDYILETDSFKDAMKGENVLGARDDIKAGKDGAVAKAKAEIKDKEKGKEPTAGGDDYVSEAGASEADGSASEADGGASEAEGGASDDECSDGGSYASVDGASMSGGSVSEASVSDYASISESSMSGGEEYEGGDDEDVEGGANIPGFRTPEEKIAKLNKKEYKKFKKEAYTDFTKKQEAYFNDEVEMSKFMDANEGDLLQMVYDGKGTLVGKWINKSASGPKKAVAANLVAAINAYVEPVEGAPPADAAPADGAAPVEGAAPAEADGAAEGDKKEEKKEEKPAPEAKGGAEPASGEVVEQGGGGGIKVNPKKKRHTRKKPQRINISINVGNKNVIDENSSDSDSSSSSSSSDSSSDDEDDEEKEVKPIVHIKSKKHTRKRHNKA